MIFKEIIIMNLTAIGKIHSPYQERGQAPRQGRLSENEITLEIFPEYTDAIKGIKRSTHMIVLYWGDRADRSVLQSPTPFSEEPMGVFASRSPNRPNPIAFCIAELVRCEGNSIVVKGVDALDGSPLLDIKTYAKAIDCIPEAENTHIPATQEKISSGRTS